MVTIDKNTASHNEHGGETTLIEATEGSVPTELSTRHLWNGNPIVDYPNKPGWLGVVAPVAGAPFVFSAHSTAKISGTSKLDGGTSVGERSTVHRDTILSNVEVGDDVTIHERASVGVRAQQDSPDTRTVIGDGSAVYDRAAISTGCHIGKRNCIWHQTKLNRVTTGDGVWIGGYAYIANIHIPGGIKIGFDAAIEGPDDLINLCPGGQDTGRPIVTFYRAANPPSDEDDSPGFSAVLVIEDARSIEEYEIDERDSSFNEMYEELAGGDISYINPALLDSPDGTYEGVVSMLRDPMRLSAMLDQAKAWRRPRVVVPG